MGLTKTMDVTSSVTSLTGTVVALGRLALSFTLLTLVSTVQGNERQAFCLLVATLLNLRAWTDSLMPQFGCRLVFLLGLLQ